MSTDSPQETPRAQAPDLDAQPEALAADVLLRDFAAVTSPAAHTALRPLESTGHSVTFNDPFEALNSFATNADGFSERSLRGGRPPGSKASANESFTVLPQIQPLAPSKPTVAVLDTFQSDSGQTYKSGNKTPAHGEISAAPAEALGYNVIRLQTPPEKVKTSLGSMLADLERRVGTGELKLGDGDAVNISMGGDDPTFKEMSEMLGFKITPENLAQNRDKVLAGIKEISTDRNAPPPVREMAKEWLQTNDAIAKLQARGITVVHAAGNDGDKKFSPGFMFAAVQLTSGRNGKSDPFSASHSLTTAGDGIVGFTAKAFNPFDPTPVASQRGEWQMAGTGARFPNTGKFAVGMGTERSILDPDRIQFNLKTKDPGKRITLPTDPVRMGTDMLSPEVSIATGGFRRGPLAATVEGLALLAPPTESGKEKITRLKVINETKRLEITDAPRADTYPRVGMIAVGTSFSNTGYFEREYERRKAIKAGGST